MKKSFTLFALFLSVLFNAAHAQIVLNEIYGDPNSSENEYFELYNTSPSSNPMSIDGVDIITYFQDGTTQGFYVLDMPAATIGPKGYFVGASAKPFNYQGIPNSTAANFSWNDLNLAANGGYLKKWILSSANQNDGNKDYDLATLPGNFNDFFNIIKGNGTNYSIFVFQNGKAVNTLYFGAGGSKANAPAFITAMPALNASYKVGSVETPFVIDFDKYKNIASEWVNQNAGTDNGFKRTKDGMCGSWTKAASGKDLTPGYANFGAYSSSQQLTISASLTRGLTATDSSTVTYNITSATSAAVFPAELQVYHDNGNVAQDLDGLDQFIRSNTENTVTDGPFAAKFMPRQDNIILMAKVAAGCIDQILFITDAASSTSGARVITTLPIKLISFTGSTTKEKNLLQWKVAENETGNYFEVQKSTNGKDFTVAGMVFTTDKIGEETYQYKENNSAGYSFYRLRIVNKNNMVSYSKTIILKNDNTNEASTITLMQNPVQTDLVFNYRSVKAAIYNIAIYNMAGMKVYTTQLNFQTGVNSTSLKLNGDVASGTYLLQISNASEVSTTKFVKQ